MALGRQGPSMPPRGGLSSPKPDDPPTPGTPAPSTPAPSARYSFSGGGLGGNRGGMRTGDYMGLYGKPLTFGKGSLGGQMKTEDPYGSQSGPGILESWFNQRATGTDPAFEYGLKRGMEQLGNQFSAAGAYNSGAARQQESDLYANLLSQRMGQLDALAGGASGERQGRLNSMFQQGLSLAGGQAGQASAYDLGAAGNMQAANEAQRQMNLNKAGVDTQAAQGGFNNLLGLYAAYQSGGKAGGNGGMYEPYKV